MAREPTFERTTPSLYPPNAPFNGPANLGSAHYDERFFPTLLEVAEKIAAKSPEDLIAVLGSETGLNPATTKGSAYKGINTIGWFPDVAGQQGTSAIMTREEWENLPNISPTSALYYTERYFLRNLELAKRSRYANALDLYLSNASYTTWVMPALEPLTPLSGYNTEQGYAANAGMDIDKDGVITVKDVKSFLQNARGRWGWMVDALRGYQAIAGLSFDPSYKAVAYNPSAHNSTLDEDLAEINEANRTRGGSRTMQSFERTGNQPWVAYGVVGGLVAGLLWAFGKR